MTRYIKSDYNQYVPANTASQALHNGSGKVRAIIATATSGTSGALTLYDNTAASGNVLIKVNVTNGHPAIIILPANYPLVFTNGLTAASSANVEAFVLTEA